MRRFPPAPVNEEGKLLERKKADSQRKKDVLHLETGTEQRIDIFQEKIAIFKISQRPQIAEAAKEHQRFPHFRGVFFCKYQADPIIKETASGYHPQEADVKISIKPQGHPNQISLCQLILSAFVKNQPARQCERQKQKNKNV